MSSTVWRARPAVLWRTSRQDTTRADPQRFANDALGRRHSRTAGGTTTQFVYGPGGILLEKQGANYTAAYTYGNGLLRREGEYPLFDGHGSERTVTNSGQTVTGAVNYEAFGQVAGTTGSSASPYMYAGDWGYRNDGDAGLTHVGARYYDAQVGRFATRSTVLSEHPYVYCEGDPANGVDPSGHVSIPGGLAKFARLVILLVAGDADPEPDPFEPIPPPETPRVGPPPSRWPPDNLPPGSKFGGWHDLVLVPHVGPPIGWGYIEPWARKVDAIAHALVDTLRRWL